MFYQSDYITKKIKEDEIAERLHQAEIDRLDVKLHPHSPSLIGNLFSGGLHMVEHFFSWTGGRLEHFAQPTANIHHSAQHLAHR